jgi:hypothetical protein
MIKFKIILCRIRSLLVTFIPYMLIKSVPSYHALNYNPELWQTARYQYQTGIDYDINEPFTDVFN